jgi:hypothetical protein
MELKKEKIIAYCLAIVLLIVGVVCYAAFPDKSPEEPIRIMFQSTAGKILFDHKGHTSEDGYGLECIDCHHEWTEEAEQKPGSCGICHLVEPIETEEGKEFFDHDMHADEDDGYGIACIDCHHEWDEDSGDDPVSCSECHEDESTDDNSIKIMDAFHMQCIGCHDDDGTAPTDCSGCHSPAKRSDALHAQCIECHEDDGTAPVDCSECHVLQ